MQKQRFITRVKSMTEYTHVLIHPQAKSKHSSKIKYNRLIDLVNKRKYIQTDAEAEIPILWPPDAHLISYLMQKADSLEKALMLGKIESRRRSEQQRMRWLDGIISSMDMGLVGLRELVMDREARHAVVHRVTKSPAQLSHLTELN